MWCIRRNAEIEESFHGEGVVNFIRAQKIQWLAHVLRMPDDRMPLAISFGVMNRPKKKGKTEKKMDSSVENDLRILV